MTNGFANGAGKQAFYTLVSTVAGVVLANMVDSPAPAVISWAWWKHVLIAIGFVAVVNEARYWKNWADKKLNPPSP